MAFDPKELRVPAGSWVKWTNHEAIGHTVTPDDTAKWGNPGSGDAPDQFLNEGDAWTFCFEKAGSYAYHCAPHATRSGSSFVGMTGTIVVS